MPELPEVETTLRGIEPYVDQQAIARIVVRNPQLRWPVPVQDLRSLHNKKVLKVARRAKYLLFHTDVGVMLLHLGMSGSLRVLLTPESPGKHDHIDIELQSGVVIRFNDPRRFGCCLLSDDDIDAHALLIKLGPEPLSEAFNGDFLYEKSRGKSQAVKNFIMDGHVVVGVGNIYASESLFESGIRPSSQAGKISRPRYRILANNIKQVLAKAIRAGGTTLNDFTQADGKPGYFRHELQVYARQGEPCTRCQSPIKSKVIGQRNTFYCSRCQK